jgi:threonine dehydratase
MHTLAEAAHVLVEPAGAAALAGLWRHRQEFAGRRVVLLLSGANVTMELLRVALSRPALASLD